MKETLKSQKSESGSLMVEIIAVLGLLALITPMLYQQISKRNAEVDAINLATEMRMLKDGTTNYLAVNNGSITAGIQCTDGNSSGNLSTNKNDIKNYLPNTEMDLSGYNFTFKSFCTADNNPVAYAIIVQSEGSQPGTLRQSAQVASLIGGEGGVVTNATGNIQGVEGLWEETITSTPKNAVAVTTLFDALTIAPSLSDIQLKNFSGKTIRTEHGVADRMHVAEFLSVGGANCVENITDVDGNMVVNQGQTEKNDSLCKPVFEVNANGEVRLGASTIITSEKLPSNMSNLGSTGKLHTRYKLDAKDMSVMNDIRLTSRGGAKLSDILPNYIVKNVQSFTGNISNITKPTCPSGYTQAITIHPTSFTLATPTASNAFGIISSHSTSTGTWNFTFSGVNAISGFYQTYCVFNITTPKTTTTDEETPL